MFLKVLIKVLIIGLYLSCFSTLYGQQNEWATTGPYDCRVFDIAINPQNNQHLAVTTIEYGIYQTFNGGGNWSHIDNDFLPTCMRVIEFHPNAPETIYVTTVQGVYKSPDSGVNWDRIYFPCGWQYEVYAFAIFGSNPDILLASGPIYSGFNYRSTDGGETWEELNIPPIAISKFSIDPIEDSVAYFITHAGSSGNAVYRSSNWGLDWDCIQNNLDSNLTARGFDVDPDDNKNLYICGHDVSGNNRTIFKSTDTGRTWRNISPSGFPIEYVLEVFVSRTSSNTLFALTKGSGLLRSNDSGENWEDANNGYNGSYAKTLEFDSTDGIFYLGTLWGGIYRSTDDCESWEKISYNLHHSECTDIALSTLPSNDIFVSTFTGIYKKEQDLDNWNFINILSPDFNRRVASVECFETDENYILAALYTYYPYFGTAVIKRSIDNGVSWETLNEGLPANTFITDMKVGIETGEAVVFLSTSSGLYVSTDNGESFSVIDDIPQNAYYYALDVSQADNDYIFTGTYELYSTDDGGVTWQYHDIPECDYLNEIKCHPHDTDILYICCFDGGVYKSEDGGENWLDITNNLPYQSGYMKFSGLEINPYNPENIFVNSHHYGFFQSHDGGDSWEAFNDSLITHYSSAVTLIDPSDTNKIYLATNEQSVWSITRTPTGIGDDIVTLPRKYNLAAYPNPFNASTQISFNLPEPSDVTLDIYDILGRKTASLVDEHLLAGQHSICWQAGGYSSGIYFYKLTAGEFVDSRMMTIIK